LAQSTTLRYYTACPQKTNPGNFCHNFVSNEALPDMFYFNDVFHNCNRDCLVERRKLDHATVVAAISQWRRRLSACVQAHGGHFEHILWCFHGSVC